MPISRVAGLVATDVAALVLLRPDPGELGRAAIAPRRWMTVLGPDRAVAMLAGAALWVVAVWVALGLITCVAARLPGALGSVASRLNQVVVPRVATRLIAGSAGLGVLLAPVAVQARSLATPSRSVSVLPSAVPAAIWPVDPVPTPGPPPATSPSARGASVPAALWPSAPPPTTTAPPRSTALPSRRSAVRTRSAALAPRRHRPQVPATGPDHEAANVRVQPGDSLWVLAGRPLGGGASDAQIAAYWPEIYAANRAVIGNDPSLVRPGRLVSEPPPEQAPAPDASR